MELLTQPINKKQLSVALCMFAKRSKNKYILLVKDFASLRIF